MMHDSEIYEQNGMRFHGDGPVNPRWLFPSMRLDNWELFFVARLHDNFGELDTNITSEQPTTVHQTLTNYVI
jgi:hypothetical protein